MESKTITPPTRGKHAASPLIETGNPALTGKQADTITMCHIALGGQRKIET